MKNNKKCNSHNNGNNINNHNSGNNDMNKNINKNNDTIINANNCQHNNS